MIHTNAVLDMLIRQRVSPSKYLVIAIPLAFDTRQESVPTITRMAIGQLVHVSTKN
jgi:hypothetical protein